MNTRSSRVLGNFRTVIAELQADGKGKILVVVAAGWSLSIGTRYMWPAVLPFFRGEFEFGLTIAGLLLSLLWFSYAIGQFPGGILGDRFGEGNILVFSTAISTVAVLIVTFSLNVWMLVVGTVTFGLASSLFGPTRFTIFTDIYEGRAGTAIGLSLSVGSVGNTVLPAMGAAVASYVTWRAGYAALIPVFIVVTVALWLWVPTRTSSGKNSTSHGVAFLLRRIFASVRREGIPVVVALQLLLSVISQGFLGFYPIYLIEIKNFSPTVAATLFGVYFAIGILVQPLTGMSIDWIGPKITFASIVGLYFVGLVALLFAQTFLQILLVTVIISNRNGTSVVGNAYIASALSEDVKGSGLGFLRMVWILIGATSPVFVGYMGDLGRLQEAFLVLAGLAGVTMVLTLFIPEE